MKIVFNLGAGRKLDIAPLRERFPEHSFVETRGAAEVARELGDAEVLIISNRPYFRDMVEAVNGNAGALKWIQFTTSGIDKALKNGGFPKGVTVTNCSGLSAPILAEHAIALLLFLSRRFRDTQAAAARRDWLRDEISPSVNALAGRTMAVCGMGATGQEVARKARAFGMKVIGVSRAYKPDDLVEEVYPRVRAKEALARADAVVLSMPATPETKGFINRDTLGAMKKTAFVVNVARGDLVDEADLVTACRAGTIGGAGLDVTVTEPTPADSPLWDVPNIVLTPHIAATGYDSTPRLMEMLAENLSLYLAGKPLKRVLDWERMAAD